MKKERYIIEIEMPNGDGSSSTYIHNVIQSDCDIEDKGRWKVSVKEYWKPSDQQIAAIDYIIKEYESTTIHLYDGAAKQLYSLLKQLKQL